jgi:hypothetical protein
MLYEVYQPLAGILAQPLGLHLEVTHIGPCPTLSLGISDASATAAAATRYASASMASWTLYKTISIAG